MTVVTWRGVEFDAVAFGLEASTLQCKIAENWGRYQRLKEPTEPVLYERCSECRAPLLGYHHVDCPKEACAICGSSDACQLRGHQAEKWPVSARQAMARLRQINAARERRATATERR